MARAIRQRNSAGWVHRADGSDHGHPDEVWPISESDPMKPTLQRPKHRHFGRLPSSLPIWPVLTDDRLASSWTQSAVENAVRNGPMDLRIDR